jgi:hypothetical protein
MVASITLSFAAVDILGEMLRLNVRPFPFEIPYVGKTDEERSHIRAGVLRDLESRGLADGRGFEPELVDRLSLLAGSDVAVTAIAMLDVASERVLTARAAASGQLAVLAVAQEDSLRLDPIRSTSLIAETVALIPQERPGPGQTVSLSLAESRSGGSSSSDDSSGGGILQSYSGGGKSQQLRAVEAMFARPRLRVGQFAVHVRDRRGRLQRGPELEWFDTDAGRYFSQTQRRGDGGDYTTFAPADSSRIGHRLSELLNNLLND